MQITSSRFWLDENFGTVTHLFINRFGRFNGTPFLQGLTQIDGTQVDLQLANLVVFGETVKIVDKHDKRCSGDLSVWQLKKGVKRFVKCLPS